MHTQWSRDRILIGCRMTKLPSKIPAGRHTVQPAVAASTASEAGVDGSTGAGRSGQNSFHSISRFLKIVSGFSLLCPSLNPQLRVETQRISHLRSRIPPWIRPFPAGRCATQSPHRTGPLPRCAARARGSCSCAACARSAAWKRLSHMYVVIFFHGSVQNRPQLTQSNTHAGMFKTLAQPDASRVVPAAASRAASRAAVCGVRGAPLCW
jgi:hypothetical protein